MTKLELTLVALTSTVLVGIAACGEPPPNKTPLVVCEAGEAGCPGADKPKASRTQTDTTESTSAETTRPPTSNPTATPPVTATEKDAGASAQLGATCSKLKVCCDALVANGIFAEFCLESLATGSENICYTKLQSYSDDPEGLPVDGCTL